jgi:hypothetical protein
MKYDWIIGKSDQQQMVALVSADCVERATLPIVPGADHNFGRHLDAQGAFDHGGDGSYPADAGQRGSTSSVASTIMWAVQSNKNSSYKGLFRDPISRIPSQGFRELVGFVYVSFPYDVHERVNTKRHSRDADVVAQLLFGTFSYGTGAPQNMRYSYPLPCAFVTQLS